VGFKTGRLEGFLVPGFQFLVSLGLAFRVRNIVFGFKLSVIMRERWLHLYFVFYSTKK